MKPIASILFIILAFSIACVFTQQPTDLDECSLKGQVKFVTTTHYFDLENNDNEWILDDTKIDDIYKMSFNERGNITEVKEYYTLDGFEQIRTTKIEFKDDLKNKFVQTNLDQQTGIGVY